MDRRAKDKGRLVNPIAECATHSTRVRNREGSLSAYLHSGAI